MRLLCALCAITAASCSFLGGGGAPLLRKARPTLPAARFLMQAEAAVPSEDNQMKPAAAAGPLAKLKESLPCAATRRTRFHYRRPATSLVLQPRTAHRTPSRRALAERSPVRVR